MLESQVDLHDTEILAAQRIVAHLNSKYSSRANNVNTLASLASEAVDLFRTVGLEVTCNPFAERFVISIDARNESSPFDPERQRYEAKKGIADDFWEQKKRQSPKPQPHQGPTHKH